MQCPRIPEISYGDFSRRLHEQVGNRRIPITGSVEVTNRCNLRCAHCYINLPAGDQEERRRELSLAQWRRLLEEITDAGCLWLLLTGGEPLLRPDFLDIYRYAKERGLLLSLFTNGTLITPAIADFLADWRPFQLEVTVYGMTAETYEAVTGVPGSFGKCMEGINLLMERRIHLAVKTMAMTLNVHELSAMQAWARGLGLEFRFDTDLTPRLDGSQCPCDLRLSPEDILSLDLADAGRRQEWRDLVARNLPLPHETDNLYHCDACIQNFHIDPWGQLSVCLMARTPAYSLVTGSFQDGWGDFLLQVRNQKAQSPSPCATCELFVLCCNCPGFALLESGQAESTVEYPCRLAHLRAAAFGVHAPDQSG